MLDLVKIIQKESYTYLNSITSTIEDLYVKFHFGQENHQIRIQ